MLDLMRQRSMTSGRTSSHSTASGSVWLGRLIGTAVLHMAEAWAPHASGVSHKKKKESLPESGSGRGASVEYSRSTSGLRTNSIKTEPKYHPQSPEAHGKNVTSLISR